jgi:porin
VKSQAIGVIFGLVSAVACVAQPSSPAQGSAPGESRKNLDYEFHSPLPPSMPETREEFRNRYFLGDWMGLRPKLANLGIRLGLLFITDPFGNLTGGRERGASDYSLLGFGVVLRTDPLLGWHGGQFHVGFAVNFGTSLSMNYVGNAFPIQLADVADPHPRLTYLSYTQSLFAGTLSIRLGRTTINSVSSEEFLGSEYFKAFTSVGIDLVPIAIFLNAPGAFGYPDTTWGARIKIAPAKRFYAMVGVYNGDPALKEGKRNGLDFSMRGPPFVISEFGFKGESSNLKFGGYYNGGTAPAFASAPDRSSTISGGRYGVYILADHALVRFGDPDQHRHLGVFGAFLASPDQRVNKIPYFFDTGFVLYGPSRSRPKDFVGFAAVYGSYSGDLRRAEKAQPAATGVQHSETTLELNYGWMIRPGLLVQPDAQYIVHPNGNSRLRNAFAVGLNIVINL